jgi:NADPH:quinone reductase-like Zn-dependent oxidoreductase
MRKAQYEIRGPVPQDVISTVEFELPPPGPGQVLVQVLAAPINPSDILTLTGQYGSLPPLPAVGGNEGVGRIAALGPEVTGLAPGQRVLLPAGAGTWTSHLLADARRLVPLPAEGDIRQLAMLSINPPTALVMLRDFVKLKPGDFVLQNAANSAVGAYVNQLAATLGIKVVNIVRRQSAVAAVQRDGGELVLVDGDDLPKRVASLCGKASARLALDAVGGAATARLALCMAEDGLVLNYGALSGEPCHMPPLALVFRSVTLRGFWLARWFRTTPSNQVRDTYAELTQLIAQGRLHARVQASYGLSQIKQAVAQAAAGERDGKVLIEPEA